MRKTLVYLLILGLLGFAVYYFLISDRTETPFTPDEAGFTITDTGSVGKLFIVDSKGQSILAERDTTGWRVNKLYKALPATVDLVLQTLATQKAIYPVTEKAYEHAVSTLSTNGIKVEVYARDGKKLVVFYVGGAAVNNSGTNMLIAGSKRPFVVQTPGFSGYLTSRYPFDMKYWRDRTIFSIPEEEISTISMQYEGKPVNSFVLTRSKDTDLVMTTDPAIMTMGPFNKRRAKVYTRYFANINSEGYLNGLPDMDSTIRTAPKFATLEVTGKHGQHQTVEMYWMAVNKRSKNRAVADPMIPDEYDADRLYAIINDRKDTVLIQQYAFRDIFHRSFEFFTKDVDPQAAPKDPERPKNVLMHKSH